MDNRRLRRTAVAAAALGGAVAFGAWTAVSGGLVLPESWVSTASDHLSTASDAVEGQVGLAMDDAQARATVVKARGLPADEIVAELQAAHAGESASVGLAVLEGRKAWWDGRPDELQRGREGLEAAVARSPDDPEVVGALVEVLAVQQGTDPAVVDLMSQLVERADALAPDALPSVRARAVSAWGSGNREVAGDIARACLELSADPSQGDPICVLVAASAKADLPALLALEERITARAPLLQATAEAASEVDDIGTLMGAARRLVEARPADARAHRLLLGGLLRTGRLDEAASTARELVRLDPDDVTSAHLLLRMDLERGGALRAIRQLAATTRSNHAEALDQYDHQAAFLADAALAALLDEDADEARALSLASLAVQAGQPQASLVAAQVEVAAGEAEAADEVLKGAEPDGLDARSRARYHLAEARIYRALGRGRAALASLEEAQEADPTSLDVGLEQVSLFLELKNLQGAVEVVEALSLTDRSFEAARDPLVGLWLPPASWDRLRLEFEEAVLSDVRYTSRRVELGGLMAFLTGNAQAGPLLVRATAEQPGILAAHAALAQLARSDGAWAAVETHASEVMASRPTDSFAQALVGLGLAGQGREAAAAKALERAAQNETLSAGDRLIIADAWVRLGRQEDAAEVLRGVVADAPEVVAARARLLDLEQSGQ